MPWMPFAAWPNLSSTDLTPSASPESLDHLGHEGGDDDALALHGKSGILGKDILADDDGQAGQGSPGEVLTP